MSAFSKIDMGEVTRLTRAGKLAEAMALLHGATALGVAQRRSMPDAPRSAEEAMRKSPPVNLLAPPESGDASTARAASDPPGVSDLIRRFKSKDTPDLTRKPRGFRHRLLKPALFPGLNERLKSRRQPPVPVPDGARFEERSFSNDAGSRSYKVYVPSGYTGQALPVVVMLHGCTQDPDDFAIGTRMNQLAEEQTFLVAYPRQCQGANLQKCWNWFKAEDQEREGGEPSLIAGIASQVVEEFSGDATRVYAAGLSAGGAAAAIMAMTYPDLFAAVGIHSGLACGAARDMPSAFAAMGGNGTPPPAGSGAPIPTIVFHGDADRTVNPINSDQVVAQAARDAIAAEVVTRSTTPAGMAYTRTVQFDAAGTEIIEQWILHGAGHAWSGGSPDGSYTEPRGPDASREMIRFFLGLAPAKVRCNSSSAML